MSAETQYKVACEFGYPENLVLKFLKKKKYRNASELVDELEDYELKCEEEEPVSDEEKEEVKTANKVDTTATAPGNGDDTGAATITHSSTARQRPLTLLEETRILYNRGLCVVCMKNKRCVVTLPCSHLALCNTCYRLPSTRKCPVHDCKESIHFGIPTYM